MSAGARLTVAVLYACALALATHPGDGPRAIAGALAIGLGLVAPAVFGLRPTRSTPAFRQPARRRP